MASTLLAGLVALGPTAARADLVIDEVEAAEYAKTGKIVFYADVLDGKKVDKKPPTDLKVFVDGNEVPGTFEITTYKDANLQLGVGVLLSATGAYASALDPEGGNNTKIIDLEKKGFKKFFENLSKQDRVSAFYYNEEDFRQIQPWSNDPLGLADKVDSELVKTVVEKSQLAPQLYGAIAKVLNSFKEDTSMPRRRVLVVMSDGSDRTAAAARERKIQEVVDAALTPEVNVKIYSVGFTLGQPEPLVDLGTLAVKTNGQSREIPFDKYQEIENEIADIAEELRNQYVITFTPTDYSGAEKPAVPVRLELKSGTTGIDMKATKDGIKIPQKATDHWNAWIKWVVFGLGGLLGIGLIFMLIRAIARSRKNRKVEVVEVEEGPVGPYKGKLACMTGVYAGKEFYLTEDVTTIGAISGNTIVLQESGVSKRHAGIKIEDMRFELADFGSTNGTWVNGAKITKQFLRDGDEIRIGDAKLRFSLK